MHTYAIVLAAGKGERFGGPKQFVKVDGKEIVQYALEAVAPWVDGIILVVPKGFVPQGQYLSPESDLFFTEGGDTRYDSIKAGFALVPDCPNVMIVDAVRCNTHENVFANLLKAMETADAAFPFSPCVNTICRPVTSENRLEIFSKAINAPMEIQTPEIAKHCVLKEAIEKCNSSDGFSIIHMVAVSQPTAKVQGFVGPTDNFKITHITDLMLFTLIVEMKKAAARGEINGKSSGQRVGGSALPRQEQGEDHPQVQNQEGSAGTAQSDPSK